MLYKLSVFALTLFIVYLCCLYVVMYFLPEINMLKLTWVLSIADFKYFYTGSTSSGPVLIVDRSLILVIVNCDGVFGNFEVWLMFLFLNVISALEGTLKDLFLLHCSGCCAV